MDEKQVYEPSDPQQAEGEEVDCARDRFSEVKPLRTRESEDPQNVTDQDVRLAGYQVHMDVLFRGCKSVCEYKSYVFLASELFP